jgi:glyoxylase-like metal-dependent hydrolase (beta-lactamase superfamily II)
MRIHRIETGKVRVKENQMRKAKGMAPQMAKVLFGREWSDWLPIYAWAIEHKEGVIVVDTGETFKTGERGYLPQWHPYYALAVDFDVAPADEIGPQLKSRGINPKKDVTKVIMTHLHTDHAGGLHHFPNSEIIIERQEFKGASGFTGILAGYLPHRWPSWLDPTLLDLPADPFRGFPRSLPVTKDGKVTIVGTPGHVKNHLSVIAQINDINYFLAGDTSYTEENMLDLIPDGIGTKESVETLRRIRAFAEQYPTVYLPAHDPKVPERMDNQKVAPVYTRADISR